MSNNGRFHESAPWVLLRNAGDALALIPDAYFPHLCPDYLDGLQEELAQTCFAFRGVEIPEEYRAVVFDAIARGACRSGGAWDARVLAFMVGHLGLEGLEDLVAGLDGWDVLVSDYLATQSLNVVVEGILVAPAGEIAELKKLVAALEAAKQSAIDQIRFMCQWERAWKRAFAEELLGRFGRGTLFIFEGIRLLIRPVRPADEDATDGVPAEEAATPEPVGAGQDGG